MNARSGIFIVVIALVVALLAPLPATASGTSGLQLTPTLVNEFQQAATDITSGKISDEASALQFGAWMSGLVCGCLNDGASSCSQLVKDICDPIGQAVPGLGTATQSIGQALSDPANAMCALGFTIGGGIVPPGVNPLERPDAVPAQPIESIEAVRWPSGTGYEYALRYQLTLSNYSSYDSIGFEVQGSSGSESVTRLSTAQQPSSASDLPLAVSFSSTDLYTKACIVFGTAHVPDSLPASLCVPVREVQP